MKKIIFLLFLIALINKAVSSPAYGPSRLHNSARTLSFDDGFEDLDELYDKNFKEGEICLVPCTSFPKLGGCTRDFFMSMNLKPMTKNQIEKTVILIEKGKVLPNCQTVLRTERKSLLTATQKTQAKAVFTSLCQYACINNLPLQQVEIPKRPLKTFNVSSNGLFGVNKINSIPINPKTGAQTTSPPPIPGGIRIPGFFARPRPIQRLFQALRNLRRIGRRIGRRYLRY